MGKKTIILKINGLTGTVLAKQLFEHKEYAEVISFHRRKSGLKHPKRTEHVVDLFKLEKEAARFKVDVGFCCTVSLSGL